MKRRIRINDTIKVTRAGDINQTIQGWEEQIEEIILEMVSVNNEEGILYGEPDMSGMIDGFNRAIKELKDNIDRGSLRAGLKIRYFNEGLE